MSFSTMVMSIFTCMDVAVYLPRSLAQSLYSVVPVQVGAALCVFIWLFEDSTARAHCQVQISADDWITRGETNFSWSN